MKYILIAVLLAACTNEPRKPEPAKRIIDSVNVVKTMRRNGVYEGKIEETPKVVIIADTVNYERARGYWIGTKTVWREQRRDTCWRNLVIGRP